MFTVELATPDVNEAFIPFFAARMAVDLVIGAADLTDPDHPTITLVERGYSARLVAPCVDHAVRLAKEWMDHADSQQPILVSRSAH